LGSPIARGRTAEIYPWGGGDRQVLKLFYASFSDERVHHEARIARAVQAAGLDVPSVGGVVEVVEADGRLGLVYERLAGVPMGRRIETRPWTLVRWSRRLAELHARMHNAVGIAGLPSQRARIERKVRAAKGLEPALRQRVLVALAEMPGGDRLCHGDFHPWNVIVSGDRATVIDWIDATCGNPLADVARTSVILAGIPAMTEMVTWWDRLFVRWVHRLYLRRYFELRPGGEEEYRDWLPIAAAARMSEDIPGLAGWLRARVEAGCPDRGRKR
jgi:tRNA A-37 threonylcarbamoyl transferase component Bud32